METLRDGKVDEALAELTQKVRTSPADPKLRVFLFQLLAVQGQWERALTQLNVAGEMDAATLPMVQTYREAIRCEVLRAEIFAGKRSPLVFGEPEPWIARLMQASKLVADGQFEQAASLRDEALEAAPATSGSIILRPSTGAPEAEPSQPIPFEWLADADTRLGPLLEAIVNGRYYWMPLDRIRAIEVDPPADLRDVVWMPVSFTFANGGQSVGLIPTRYPGSERDADPLVRLARKTDWQEAGGGAFLGLGQRMLATDSAEFALMDVREIHLDSPDQSAAEAEEATATDG
jgi:type VI secretion system protein ImpE